MKRRLYQPRSAVRAFTLVELMAATTISIGLILLMYQIFDRVQDVFVEGQNRAVAMDEARSAMDIIVEDIESMTAGIDGGAANLEWVIPANIGAKGAETVFVTQFQNITDKDFLTLQPQSEINPDTANTGPIAPGEKTRLFHHNIRFFSERSGVRLVHYKFGGISHYRTVVGRDSTGKLLHKTRWDWVGRNYFADTPVGALWVYRSPERLAGEAALEKEIHSGLIEEDDKSMANGSINIDPLGFGKLISGVIHFRVRAVDPKANTSFPGRKPMEYGRAENPFVGSNLPSHVEIEIAVLEEKLLKEVQQGMDQQLEGLGVAEKYDKRLEYIRENSDRVYFFKQLVRVNFSKGGGND